jgi:hypothetical protein
MRPVRKPLNSSEYDPTILLHPNIPKPLHGLNPRTIMGDKAWLELSSRVRGSTSCCMACGTSKFTTGTLDCHEEYEIDYAKGTSRLKRYVAICKSCHDFIHCGRMKNMMKTGQLSRSYYIKILLRGRAILKKHKLRKTKYHGEVAEWGNWRLIFNGQKHKPIFKNMKEWRDNYMKQNASKAK